VKNGKWGGQAILNACKRWIASTNNQVSSRNTKGFEPRGVFQGSRSRTLLLCVWLRDNRLLDDLSLHEHNFFHPIAVIGLILTSHTNCNLGHRH